MDPRKAQALILEIKACDLRSDTLLQCAASVDRGIHIGGAYSAIPPLTALYYGGHIHVDVRNPASTDQDLFVLSKGHAVAALASVYADLGYIKREDLKGTRGYGALIKGHPGPCIPGVPVSTGPLGQGISLAAGFALSRLETGKYRVFTLVGDGELQEGSCWEGIQFAGDRKLRNLCVMVDANRGQSDLTTRLFVNMDRIGEQMESFGFRVYQANSRDMETLLEALDRFDREPDPLGRPTAIICNGEKGMGGYGSLTGKHKAVMNERQIEQEQRLLSNHRQRLADALEATDAVRALARGAGYELTKDGQGKNLCRRLPSDVQVQRAKPRSKSLIYDESALPRLDSGAEYGVYEIMGRVMALFAEDERLYTVDSDLSNASGLYDGTRATNRAHAINVGIAECNMMCIAEALAAEGAHVWCSTFTPFFSWQAFRRIAVSWQERQETINAGGWLAEGHNLDITFLGTAANLDTGVNGATHMGNDDICVYGQIAHLRIIDVCCPRQLVAVARWIARGGRGLVYLRTMRNPARPLYPEGYEFEYGKGYRLKDPENAQLYIVSSGHGVTEALQAAELLGEQGIPAGVIDMPSFDGELLCGLAQSGKRLLIAEQNNGAVFRQFAAYALQRRITVDAGAVLALNTLTDTFEAQFIPSGTYEELTAACGLDARSIAKKAEKWIGV